MIFITLGSQKFQFNRLLQAIDDQITSGKIVDEVFAQIGASDYKPKQFPYKDFLNREEFADWMNKASLVITHGGTGAIIGAVKNGKKVVAVPRLAKYGEHVDDHQLQLIGQFKEMNLICDCEDCNDIWKAVELAKKTEFQKYQSNTERIISSIELYLQSV